MWRHGGAKEQALPRVSFVQLGGQPLKSFASRSDYYANRNVGDAEDGPHFYKITYTLRYIFLFYRIEYSGHID